MSLVLLKYPLKIFWSTLWQQLDSLTYGRFGSKGVDVRGVNLR